LFSSNFGYFPLSAAGIPGSIFEMFDWSLLMLGFSVDAVDSMLSTYDDTVSSLNELLYSLTQVGVRVSIEDLIQPTNRKAVMGKITAAAKDMRKEGKKQQAAKLTAVKKELLIHVASLAELQAQLDKQFAALALKYLSCFFLLRFFPCC
jgi:hypothetical protein